MCCAVVLLDNDQNVRILPLGAFDSPFDRDFLALIVEQRMTVMRVRGGRGAYTDNRCQMNHHVLFHSRWPPTITILRVADTCLKDLKDTCHYRLTSRKRRIHTYRHRIPMRRDSGLPPGTLDMLILRVLASVPLHGYAIAQ